MIEIQLRHQTTYPQRHLRSGLLGMLLFLISVFPLTASAIDYNVGPGQTLADLNAVPWWDLAAGDNVNIYWREEPYRTKVGIRARGTVDKPVTIRGILGPGGERPVLTGENAVTPPSLRANFFSARWDEMLAVILIKRTTVDVWGYKPGHIIIENLRIEKGHSPHTYTAADGVVRGYSDAAAGIWASLVENLIVRNCEITDNGNGFFVLSKSDIEEVSNNILLEYNHVHNNGTSGSYRQHNLYTQVQGITLQYNNFGTVREGAWGSNIKDRSSGTVIRYNYIESAARTLDLVDPEDARQHIVSQPDFSDTYVYGNIIRNDGNSGAMIHYGGDSGLLDGYRDGTLHFYYNTVFIRAQRSSIWRMRLFDVEVNTAKVDLYNNIIFHEGDSNFMLMDSHGIANLLGTNWISEGWQNGDERHFDGKVNVTGVVLTGTSPGFVNKDANILELADTSRAREVSSVLPASITNKYPVTEQYVEHLDHLTRTNLSDLGAYAYKGVKISPPMPPSNLSVTVQ